MENEQVTFETVSHGDILRAPESGSTKYLVMIKRDLVGLALWPNQRCVLSLEPEEFNSMKFYKVTEEI